MTSRKDLIGKYSHSDIFNLIQKPSFKKEKQKRNLNRSNLENTKEQIFNIGKEKRISRKFNKDERISHSTEKRKKNYEKIYGSDIFNLRSKSVERRKGRLHMPNITNRSTCFEEMKNNEEYLKDFQEYTKEKRGNYDMNNMNNYINKSDFINDNETISQKEDFNEGDINYIKRRSNLEKNNNKRIIKRNERNNQLYFGRKYPVTLYTSERRRFVDLDEFPENNCKINKQIQFESHLFSDEEHYYKTNEEIQKIQNRINQEKNNHNNLNILGQPIIRVNRLKRSMNTHSSMNNIHTKMKPTNMKWDSLQSQVMFSQDYTTNLYKKYGPKGPTAYQRRLHQFADSDNIDTCSGLEKNNIMNNFKYLQKPKNEEKQCKEEQKKIDEMIENIPNLSEGKKLEIKMKSSILDFKDDNELNNKIKDLNNFLLKEKKKKKEVTEKVNHIDKIKNEKNENIECYDYTITYGIKGNNFENYNENEIKNMFGKKGINIYEIHKNNFNKGNFNTINIKVSGNNINDELNKKLKLMQEELIKKNYKLKIEKGNKSTGIKNIVNNPGGKISIMKDNLTNVKNEKIFKIMPPNYRNKSGFSKQFSAINYSYKNLNQIN